MKIFRKLFPSKEQRDYDKMHRRHRKELVKLAKETGEWDWAWLHRMVLMQIKHMHEYYTAGNNVWQTDETRIPIIEQLQHILDLEVEIDRMQDDDNGVEYIRKDGKVECVYPDDFGERIKKHEEREQQLYEELYSSIGRNLRWWWD